MTSSMLTGERRWASARRGGMTVLGKVAVPKPINLPSQRLENHGLDPSVEIVPKGTHSWGSKSSSSTPNAWGSSTLSPNTDGGSGSPSHLSGRPSSGSGTRPSTANSDKTHEPIANAWGSNSRPSSASGVLTSNQASLASLRPRSAETRPGSSQLSRFADPLSDNSVAWSATGTAEKLGVGSSKNDGFSLTSGDFPSLGSEKENSGKNMESQDGSHGRPGSSSGCIAPGKESNGNSAGDTSIATNAKIEPANSWRRENPMYGEDGPRPSIDKWHHDPQPYPNSNIHPQNYDAWRGPPVNNHPGGAWYRGPPGGPHFVPPVPPGGPFPMEPFPYYRPQQGPPPGPLPRGPRPTNGDIYRPHMHDAYIRPGMPFGPGFYPGPVPYEGYYRPPVGYCNSAERDIPFMGMAVGPANYNRYSGQIAHDPGNSHGRSGGYGPSGKPKVSEQVESGHPQDARGPYRVLLKQHDGSEGIDEEQRWDDTMTANASYPGKVDHRRKLSGENDWRADDQDDDERNTRRMPVGEVSSSEATDNREGVKPLECVGNWKAADYSLVNKLDRAGHGASAFQEISGPSKDPSLIKKIEGLNAKARASDGRQDVKFVSSREEQKNKLQVGNAKSNHPANETNNYVSRERTHASGIIDTVSHEDHISDEEMSFEAIDASGRASSRRSTHGVHSRGDHRGKGRFNTEEADGWRKRSQAVDMPSILSSSHFESSDVHRQDNASSEAIEKSASYQVKDDGDREAMPSHTDLGDSQMQRAKMKELAIQRIKQRKKEEEERTRDQKAKAFAKLEELNKRTKAMESVIQKSDTDPSSAIQNKHEEPSTLLHSTGVAGKSSALSLALGSNPNVGAESSTIVAENSISLSSEVLPELPKATHEEPVAVHEQMKPLQWDASLADAAYHNNAAQINDSRTSKQKRVSYRQKQNSPLEKTTNEKLTSSSVQKPKSANDVTADASGSVGGANEIALNAESSLPINPTIMVDSAVRHKRKSRTGKNKHRAEEASSAAVVPALVSKETTPLDTSVERGKSSESVLDPCKFQSQTDSRDGNQLLDQRTSSPNEEAHGKIANQWKPHHSRKMQRNPQANKSTEKFQIGDAVIWAPVRSQSKIESIDEVSEETLADAVSPPMKSDQQMQSNPRNKRAEMERYIPKPVAKEMAQQGSSHQSVAALVDQITLEETVARPESGSSGAENSQTSAVGIGKVGSVMESRNGDGRHGKLGKSHGSWRQRSAVESTTSSTSRSVQKSIEHHQSQKPDVSIVKEQSSHSEEWNASDGWNIPENSDVPTVASAIKDQGATAKGRRHSYKGQKGTGYNHDLDEKRFNSGDTEKVYAQPSSSEIHQSELPAGSKENRAVGDRSTSHWQPKSQPFSATNQHGRTNGSQNVSAEVGRSNKKGSTFPSGMQALPQSDKETTVVKEEPRPDLALSEKSNLEEVTSTGHQEGRKERKISHKGHPSNPVEPSSSNMDFRHEQRGSSGFRKNGNQNSRFGREQDSRGDWSASGKDNKQHSVPASRERQRHNSHYEYQPVGPQNNNRTSHFESAKDVSHNSSARPRERGQSHPRRGGGNFYGRQTGNVRVETSYD